jgi:hypothetical protein
MVGPGQHEDGDRFHTMSLQTLPSTKREWLNSLKLDRKINYVDDIPVSASLSHAMVACRPCEPLMWECRLTGSQAGGPLAQVPQAPEP